jgi:hypothetical protein
MVKAECYLSRREYSNWSDIGLLVEGRIFLKVQEKPQFYRRLKRISNGFYYLEQGPDSYNRVKKHLAIQASGSDDGEIEADGTVELFEVDVEEALVQRLEWVVSPGLPRKWEIENGECWKPVPPAVYEGEEKILEFLAEWDKGLGRT